MASHDGAEEELDDILDSALEDFARVSGQPPAQSTSTCLDSNHLGAGKGVHAAADCDVPVTRSKSAAEENVVEEVKGLGMPALGKKKKGKKPQGQGSKPSLDAIASSPAAPGGAAATGASSVKKRTARTLTDTLEQLAAQTRQTVDGIRAPEVAAASSREGDEGEGISAEEEAMMEKLVKQFEEMGTGDMQGLMDTMLQQLLSKEVLHEPMVEIRNRYPDWLSANSSKLSPDDLSRYTKQYECIQRLCTLYEAGSNDFTAILAVMKEMQECGQPPAEIIQDLAPGLEIGEDGLPVIPDLAAGDLPANCSIM